MSGAEPWMGSYRPGAVCVEGAVKGGLAKDADGKRPRDPGITLDWSDRLRDRQTHQNNERS